MADDKIVQEWINEVEEKYLKAFIVKHDVFKKQILSYLKATGLKLGFLVNFGSSRLEIKRFVNEYGKNPRNPLIKS